MPSLRPSIETLRGFGEFTRVITRGKTYEKKPIKAFVCLALSTKTGLHVGYTVTKRIRNATQRNRVKRLMKEAFRANKGDLIKHLNEGTQAKIIFMYNGEKEAALSMIRFESINRAVSSLCSIIGLSGNE